MINVKKDGLTPKLVSFYYILFNFIFKTCIAFLNKFHMVYLLRNIHVLSCIYIRIYKVFFVKDRVLLSCFTSIQCTYMEYNLNFKKKLPIKNLKFNRI